MRQVVSTSGASRSGTMVLVHVLTAASLLLCLSRTAGAQYRHDGLNDHLISVAGKYNVSSVGFFYTPINSFWVNRIETYFNPDAYYEGCCSLPQERPITLEILTAPRSDGGTLMRTASFNSLEALGQLGGTSFQPLFFASGTSYFIGFRNVLGIGANLTFVATHPHDTFRYDWPEPFGITGQYAETQNLRDQPVPDIGPILRFSGPRATGRPNPMPVPKPGPLPMLAVALAVLVMTSQMRRRDIRSMQRAEQMTL